MKQKYTIPGYFENCLIKDNKVVEEGFFGKTLYEYSNHELKEFKFFGSTVLIFKRGGIYKPGFFGERLFDVDKYGRVKEKGFFGSVVGSIPTEWMATNDDAEENAPESETKKEKSDLISSQLNPTPSFDSRYQTLEELAEEEDEKMGWCADFTNVKDGASTISCPKRYKTITAIAPALRGNGLKNIKVHSNVQSIQMDTACGYFFIVDPDNQKYCSVDGVLYSKDKRILYSIPQDSVSFNIPDFVEAIGPYALSFSSLASIVIPSSVHVICKKAFAYDKKLKSIYIPNTVLKIAGNAFEGNKKMVIETAFLEKPASWDFDLNTIKEIKWGVEDGK